ncbi:MAG: J-domain-containing protein [Paracoccaceae bacterium]
MSWLNKLAERQIALARAEGKLQGLEGEGKPLPEQSANAFVSASDAIGFHIMAGAGALPEEITLAKAAEAQRAHLATLTDAAERRAAMAVLADIEMRRAIAAEARRKFLSG